MKKVLFLLFVFLLSQNVDGQNVDDHLKLNQILVEDIDSLELVMSLVEQGADVNYQDKYQNTVLGFATMQSSLKVVKYLVAKGAKCNNKGIDGLAHRNATLTGQAAKHSKMDILKFLIDECGVDVDDKDGRGQTALHIATIESSKYLIDKGANINAIDHKGQTPLIIAAGNTDDKKVNLLIKNRANVNISSRLGTTAVLEATRTYNLKVLNLLIDAGTKISKYEGKTVLRKTIQISIDEEKRAIQANKYDGKKAVTTKLRQNTFDLIEKLAKNGVNLDIHLDKGQTALIRAVNESDLELSTFLIKNGAGLNTPTTKGQTALMVAIGKHNMELIKILIDSGADVDTKDRYGVTPLMHAVLANEIDIVKLLIDKKASIHAVDNKGYTAFQLATDPKTKDILRTNGGKNSSGLKPILIPAIGHTAKITTALYSPEGQFILTGSDDRTAKLWDVKTGKLIRDFVEQKITHCAFSADGQRIFTGDLIWDIKTGSATNLKTNLFKEKRTKYSPNKQQRTERNGNSVKIWDLKFEETLHVLSGHTRAIKSAVFSPDRHQVFLNNGRSGKIWDTRTGNLVQNIFSDSSTIRSVNFSPDGQHIVVTNESKRAQLLIIKSGKLVHEFIRHRDTVTSAFFSPNGQQVITTSKDETAKLWDVKTGKMVHNFWGFYKTVKAAACSPDGHYVVCCDTDGRLLMSTPRARAQLWDTKTGELVLKFEETSQMQSIIFSPDGKQIISNTGSFTKLWDVNQGWLQYSLLGHVSSFSPNGQLIITAHRDGLDHNAKLWNSQTGYFIRDFIGHTRFINTVKFSPNGKQILTASRDNTAKLWDVKTGNLIHDLLGHTGNVHSAVFSQNGQYIYTVSDDNSLKIWDTKTGKELLTFYQIDDNDWAVLHPSGLFDATPGAMKKMHYVVGLEPIELDQLKTVYHLPGLWEMVMNGEELPRVKFDEFNLFPTAELSFKKEDPNLLKIKLKKRDGGYGKISIFIGRKRIIEDALPENLKKSKDEISINVNLLDYSHLLYSDTINKIRVLTFNKEEYLRSRYYDIDYQPIIPQGKKGQQFTIHPKSEKRFPNFYGVFVGISEYEGNKADLNYADEDAIALEKVIHAAATELLIPVNKTVETKVLATAPNQISPTKENIKNAILAHKDISANDVFFLHLSGHGATGSYMNDKIELHDFFFFTKDAKSANTKYLDNPQVRKEKAISSTELAEWLNQIPAERIVVIIDACYAEKGSRKIMLAMAKGVSPKQKKALDRMKDNTGIFILAGSASSQASWELPQYRHGILTYCLLDGLNGDALKDGEYLDIIKWFQYAIDRVPEISPEKQTPTFDKNYNASSFSIGKITKNILKRIDLAAPTVVMTSAIFQDNNEQYDVLKLSQKVNNHLRNFSIENGTIIYAPKNNTGYKISGGYVQSANQVIVKFRLFKDDVPVCDFIQIEAKENEIAKTIMKQALEIIEGF